MTWTIDLSGVEDKEQLHDLLQEILPLPDYYGRNLDALYDVLTEVSEPMEIRILNISAAETAMGAYTQAFLELCEDVSAENPMVTFQGASLETGYLTKIKGNE